MACNALVRRPCRFGPRPAATRGKRSLRRSLETAQDAPDTAPARPRNNPSVADSAPESIQYRRDIHLAFGTGGRRRVTLGQRRTHRQRAL
eukprot:3120451-Pyramimonas_sp.AAC.1